MQTKQSNADASKAAFRDSRTCGCRVQKLYLVAIGPNVTTSDQHMQTIFLHIEHCACCACLWKTNIFAPPAFLHDTLNHRLKLFVSRYLVCRTLLREAEARQSLEFEQMRQSQLETRLKELEAEMAETRARCSDLQSCLNQKAIANAELDRHDTAGSAADEEELRKLQLQLCEEKVKSETLAASRDHFRRKVEELCKKLLEKTDVPKHGADQTRPAHQSKASPQCTLETEVPSPHFSLDWLQQQKRELLESGLYTQVFWHELAPFLICFAK